MLFQFRPPSAEIVEAEFDCVKSGSSATSQNSGPLLKKPVLTSKEYETALEEEEQTLDLLYDFYAIDAWLNHPVKRFKPESKEHQRNVRWSKNGDLYSMFAHNNEAGPNGESKSGTAAGVATIQNFIKQEIKMEPGCPVSSMPWHTFFLFLR